MMERYRERDSGSFAEVKYGRTLARALSAMSDAVGSSIIDHAWSEGKW